MSKNMKPRVFIGSSVEGLNVAYAIQQNLGHDAESTVWDQGVFELSQTSLESLTEVLGKVDFGVFVFSPDDITNMRGQSVPSVRDNVLFEFGLFVGKLSRQRVFFIIPEGEDVKMPTDMLGITPGKYDPNRQDKSYQAATGAACNQIRVQIGKLGFITTPEEDLPAGKESDLLGKKWIDYFIRAEYPKAKEELERIISEEAGEDALEDKAWLSFINLKMDEKDSLQKLKELSEQHKEKIDFQSLVARMMLLGNYPDEAISLTDCALSDFPGNKNLLLLKAECFESIGDTEGAKAILTDAHPEECPEIAIELSRLYEKGKDIDAAINVIHPSFLNFPNNNDIRYRYSFLLTECKRNKEALYLLNSLTLKDSKNVEYWGYLSNCCLTLELYDRAMIACREAEKLSNGEQSWILSNIGNLLSNKGFYSEAMSWLNKGLIIEPSSQYAHERLASAIKSNDEEYKQFSEICKEGQMLLREYKARQESEPEQESQPTAKVAAYSQS